MAAPETGTLRVGILSAGTTFQRWQMEAVRQALAVPGVVPVLRVEQGSGKAPTPKLLGRLFDHLWNKNLTRRNRNKNREPLAMVLEEWPESLQGVPRMVCGMHWNGVTAQFSPGDLEAIAAHGLDVLLCFGSDHPGGGILNLPRHGVWSFHHGIPTEHRVVPPGFWEILHGGPVTAAVLERLAEPPSPGRILRQGWFRTTAHSLLETVDTVLTHSSPWPAQVLRELVSGNTVAADGEPRTEPVLRNPLPGNVDLLRFLWKLCANKLRFRQPGSHRTEEWNIGVLYQPITTVQDEGIGMNVRWLSPPRASTKRTTPFGYLTADDELNVLYGKFENAVGRGEISRLRPKRDNILKRSRTMLTADGHLSHPYVVKRDGTVYVIPESVDDDRVDLYRVNDANDALERLGTLLHEALHSPTVFEHEGRWWLFGTKAPLADTGLHAYWSDRLEGPYTSHPLNPVKIDVRSARPAGTPFRNGDELWRPGQDNALGASGRIALNHVLELTPTRFREETVRYVVPLEGTAYPNGIGTLSAVGDITLIDGRRLRAKPEQVREPRRRRSGKPKHQQDE